MLKNLKFPLTYMVAHNTEFTEDLLNLLMFKSQLNLLCQQKKIQILKSNKNERFLSNLTTLPLFSEFLSVFCS